MKELGRLDIGNKFVYDFYEFGEDIKDVKTLLHMRISFGQAGYVW